MTPDQDSTPPALPTANTSLSQNEKNWAMAAHLSALAGFLVPFANVIAPIVIWQTKKDTMPFAAQEAKESLNFQISMLIYLFVAALTIFILIGFLLVPALMVAEIVFVLIAGIGAGDGKAYRYPFTIRFL